MSQMSVQDQAIVRAMPGNDKCAECGMKNPQWASVSFGTVFCLECSGVHRYVCVWRNHGAGLVLSIGDACIEDIGFNIAALDGPLSALASCSDFVVLVNRM